MCFVETPPPIPVRVTPKHTVFYNDESLKLEAKFRGNFVESHWCWRGTADITNCELLKTSNVTAVTNVGQTYSIAPGTVYHQTGYYAPVVLAGISSPVTPRTENTVVVGEHGKCKAHIILSH